MLVHPFFVACAAAGGFLLVACPLTPDAADDDLAERSEGCGVKRRGEPFEYPVLLDVDAQGVVLERRYGLRVPERYDDERPYPVVLVFHGDADCVEFDADADACVRSQEASTGAPSAFGLEPLIGDDAVIVYVEGRNLNAFEPQLLSWDTFRPVGDNADFAFVDGILATVEQELCIDKARTFAVGFSGGGFFVDSLACLRGGVTAVATFQGGFEAGELEVSFDVDNVIDLKRCVGPPPAALIVHAKDDTVVPPRYGDAAAEHFRSVNSCSDQTAPSDLDLDCRAFAGCNDGGDTVLCTPDSADFPRTHAIWTPQGPPVVSSFFQSFF